MALHGTIEVNGKIIGAWSAVRADHTAKQPEAMDIVSYDCGVAVSETLEGNVAIDWKGRVTHRFGDGALALAARVLSVASTESHVQL